MVRIVAATRMDEAGFRRNAPLVAAEAFAALEVTCLNASPLGFVYNRALASAEEDDVLVFTHDDVRFGPSLVGDLDEALARFDVVGVAGNRRRFPGQTAWLYGERFGEWDAPNLSGRVHHAVGGHAETTEFGPTPAAVWLLDGVFLAARAGRLRRAGVRFDLRFPFHFYDLDFCRACERAGLTMGTWPIDLTHASGGRIDTPEWRRARDAYLAKWGNQAALR